MGKLIEFKRPIPTMDKITGKTQDKSGAIASPPTAPETDIHLPKFVLGQVIEFVDDIQDVLIMVRDKTGTVGFVTSLDGYEPSMAFIEEVKFGMQVTNATQKGYNPGNGDTPKG